MEVKEESAYYLAPTQRTELGELPSDWNVAALDEFKPFVTSGSRGWAAYYSDVGSPFLRITNLSRARIYPSTDDLRYVAVPSGNSEGIRTSLNLGDVLISITADIGIVGLITPSVDLPAYINQHIALVRFERERVDTRYLAYFLAGAASQRRFKSMTDAGAKAGMNLAGIRNVLAALPPTIEEQHSIAQALADADALIESLDQLLIKKRQIKQGAMQELLTGKRRLPGFVSAWSDRPLGDIASVQRGASPRPIDDPVWFDDSSSVGWVRISDVTQSGMFLYATTQRLSEAGVRKSRFVSAGSLIMSICATVGRPIITKLDTCIHDGFVVFDDLKVDQMFLYYALMNIERDWVKHGQTGSQMNLNTGLINRAKISVPDDENEQRAIAEGLSDMDIEIDALDARLTKARNLKQAMTQALLTGRIRFAEPQAV